MKIEDLIPKALLDSLQEQDLALVHSKEGWVTLPTSSLLINGDLKEVKEKLDAILNLLKEG